MRNQDFTEYNPLIDSDVILISTESKDEKHTEDMEQIINAAPRWILKWGITMIFLLILIFILISTVIKYPDIVATSMKVNSLNSPKAVLAKSNGKLGKLLVREGQKVRKGETLGYLETTGSPEDIFLLKNKLKELKMTLSTADAHTFTLNESYNLGELQTSFKILYGQFLDYSETLAKGYLRKRLNFLKTELSDVSLIKNQIVAQQKIQKREFQNAETEYRAYQTLYKNKVISRSEFATQENKYLAAKYPGQNSQTALISNTGNFTAKQKEILEITHLIDQQKTKLIQAVDQAIADINSWITKNTFIAPIDGKVNFAGVIQQDQNLTANQEIFIIDPGDTNFFGEVHIPQYNMGKISVGERVLVKMHGYPYQQYGFVRGRLVSVSEVPYRDSIFLGKITFEKFENKRGAGKIILKSGMLASAEIVTKESSLFQRFYQTLYGTLTN